jgi:hypothetical protein
MFWQEESLLSDQYVDVETEVLQTDIQRFVAILGFCLMAVFALVQAIPVTSPEKDTTTLKDLVHKEKEPRVESITPVEERGLYVAFESDRVFLDLLGSGKIRLFINVMGMKKGFQVVKKGGRLDFRAGGPGNGLDLWEVKENMVPFEILEAFSAWTTLSSREKMLIVGLTPEISRQIRERKVSIGRFIIREGGSVTYNPDGE